MIGWTTRPMRHVPEDELHAYLDQALSRSQCVEIETHLAECAHCRDERDAIAGIRDCTTALLATLSPRALILPPPFEPLAERRSLAAMRAEGQRRVRRAGLWAAGVGAAGGGGGGGGVGGADLFRPASKSGARPGAAARRGGAAARSAAKGHRKTPKADSD